MQSGFYEWNSVFLRWNPLCYGEHVIFPKTQKSEDPEVRISQVRMPTSPNPTSPKTHKSEVYNSESHKSENPQVRSAELRI